MRSVRCSKLLRVAVGCLCLVFAGLFGCGGSGAGSSAGPAPTDNLPPAVAQAQRNSTPVDNKLVAANNGFGFSLFDQLRKADPGKNVFISPTSIALALEMTYNGAATTTQQQMAQALQLSGMSLADLNAGNAALQASLVAPDPAVQINIANSLWVRGNLVKPDFVQANRTYYGSEIGDVAGAPDNVNAWVNKQTNGKIPTILPNGDYSDVVAIIANAVYFKGQWTEKFDPNATQDSTFTTGDGSQKPCKMMAQTGVYGYYKGDNFQAVRLPYGQKRMSMIVVLPDAGTALNTILDNLNLQNWNAWLGQFQDKQGDIALPRFTSNYVTSLQETLSALGMVVAFDPNRADFSNMVDPAKLQAYIKFVYHKTYVDVNEDGTTAAAATAVGIGASSAPAPQFSMRMDHPFFYAIRDDKTGEILFLGEMTDPGA